MITRTGEVLSTRTRRQFITTTSAAIGLGAEPAVTSIPTERAKALMALFGLKYPIFEAPHGNMTCPELAIAVSNAGALGALGLSIASAEKPALPFQPSARQRRQLFSSTISSPVKSRSRSGLPSTLVRLSCSFRGVFPQTQHLGYSSSGCEAGHTSHECRGCSRGFGCWCRLPGVPRY